MALKSTIFKAELQLADMDRQVYGSYKLTLSRHPSETAPRMMLRLAAFAVYADDGLEFGRGISTDDEPDLWNKSLDGRIERWIDLGQPDAKRLRKACGQAERVVIITYSGHAAEIWWRQNHKSFARFDNLEVFSVSPETMQDLGAMAQRNMELQVTIQDGLVWITDGQAQVELKLVAL